MNTALYFDLPYVKPSNSNDSLVSSKSFPKSINIPLGELRDRLAELPQDQTIYVSCQVGLRGYLASRILEQHGYNVCNVSGGYKTYAAVYSE